MRGTLVALVLLAGCGTPRYAIVGGKRVERPSFGYTDGGFFAVEHHRAYPDVFTSKRPFFVKDGELTGKVCDLDVDFTSEWYGNLMTLYGRAFLGWSFGEGRALAVAIDDLGGGRTHIHGGHIDIDASADRVVADIDTRHVELQAAGHYLVGRLVQHTGRSVEAPFVIYGREVLRTMVPADKALILILMISCNTSIEYAGRQERGFSLVSSELPMAAAPPVGGTEVIRGAEHDHGGPIAPYVNELR
jgi:hypothetical protein